MTRALAAAFLLAALAVSGLAYEDYSTAGKARADGWEMPHMILHYINKAEELEAAAWRKAYLAGGALAVAAILFAIGEAGARKQ